MLRRMNFRKIFIVTVVLCALFSMSGCDKEESQSLPTQKKSRTTVSKILVPEGLGSNTVSNSSGTVYLDQGNIKKGFVSIKYTGDADKVQVQVEKDGERTPYPLQKGNFESIPFTAGDGVYKVSVLAHIKDNNYLVAYSQEFDVKMESEFFPFLYPNQYCKYDASSDCVRNAIKLSDQSADDLDYIKRVYNYVIKNIDYDEEFAKAIPVNYIPSPDRTIQKGKGICLDYASLTTAMLRSQGIPTKLEVGYSGDVYHAWISVWTKETGWIDRVIEFKGNKWTLIDPTLASNNSSDSVRKYIGDGSNYTLKFVY